MKVAFIHNEKKISTGANYINDLISANLKAAGTKVKNIYPKVPLIEDSSPALKGLANILFFYSLLEHRGEILKYDLVQGTTYTPLPFLAYKIPTVSHFGSVTREFIRAVPLAKDLTRETKKIWYEMRAKGAIGELNVQTRRPLRDIVEIEKYVAMRVDAVIATSTKVKNELIDLGVAAEKITVIHNAIEDYWFAKAPANNPPLSDLRLVFLGRIGRDAFTLKLKGVDRLIQLYRKFPEVKKVTICMTTNKKLKNWLMANIKEQSLYVNLKKDLIPNILKPLKGSILFLPSRYEGFSLSLVEGMSQGLIPITYPVGVAPEIIRHGENGFLVNNQMEAIIYVERLLADPKLRASMTQQSQATAQAFRSGVMVKQMAELYQKIISQYKIKLAEEAAIKSIKKSA